MMNYKFESFTKSHPSGLRPEGLELQRYDRKADTWDTVLERVTVFDIQGRFMYASIFKNKDFKTMVGPRFSQFISVIMISLFFYTE